MMEKGVSRPPATLELNGAGGTHLISKVAHEFLSIALVWVFPRDLGTVHSGIADYSSITEIWHCNRANLSSRVRSRSAEGLRGHSPSNVSDSRKVQVLDALANPRSPDTASTGGKKDAVPEAGAAIRGYGLGSCSRVMSL